MNKLILAAISAVVAVAFSMSAVLAMDHCGKYADLKGKSWVDGDCMDTPLGEKWSPHPLRNRPVRFPQSRRRLSPAPRHRADRRFLYARVLRRG